MTSDFRSLWQEALPWSAFFAPDMDLRGLWEGIYNHAVVPQWATAAAAKVPGLKFLVLAEDWCGDATNTVPVVARLAEAAPGVQLRILPRDLYLPVMDRYLTNGSRSIPIVIGLDAEFRELGHWGPRPSELQVWVMANKDSMPKPQRYAETRRWYAKDKGETTLREIFAAVGADGRIGG